MLRLSGHSSLLSSWLSATFNATGIRKIDKKEKVKIWEELWDIQVGYDSKEMEELLKPSAVQDLSCSLKVIMFIFRISLNLTSQAGSVNLQLKIKWIPLATDKFGLS